MAAILNFSKTLKRSLAHIVGNVVVKFELTSGGHFEIWKHLAILKFGSIFKKSLAHPHVARNVMLKFEKKLTKRIF